MAAADRAAFRWLGLDGARGGWAAAALTPQGDGELQLVETIEEALLRWPGVQGVLVDMPVGLPGAQPVRRCDRIARKLLPGRRSSSVFSPPCRRALAAADHAQANRINREVTGRGLSVQAWHLAPRIREVDELLRRTPRLQRLILESHPELVFHCLAHRIGPTADPLPPKRTREGMESRRRILAGLLPSSERLLDDVETPRRSAAADDWIDALVLAVVLRGDDGAPDLLPDPPETDAMGLRMAMAVPGGAASRPLADRL